jgi:hypothetical protein
MSTSTMICPCDTQRHQRSQDSRCGRNFAPTDTTSAICGPCVSLRDDPDGRANFLSLPTVTVVTDRLPSDRKQPAVYQLELDDVSGARRLQERCVSELYIEKFANVMSTAVE